MSALAHQCLASAGGVTNRALIAYAALHGLQAELRPEEGDVAVFGHCSVLRPDGSRTLETEVMVVSTMPQLRHWLGY